MALHFFIKTNIQLDISNKIFIYLFIYDFTLFYISFYFNFLFVFLDSNCCFYILTSPTLACFESLNLCFLVGLLLCVCLSLILNLCVRTSILLQRRNFLIFHSLYRECNRIFRLLVCVWFCNHAQLYRLNVGYIFFKCFLFIVVVATSSRIVA